MKLKKYYIQNKNLLTKKIKDHTLVINKKTGKYAEISGLSLFIWNKVNKKITFDEILNGILENYDVKKEIAKSDLSEFLRVSVKNSFIKTIDR